MRKFKVKINQFAVGAGLLQIPFFSLLTASALFAIGLKIYPFVLTFAIILSLLSLYLMTRKSTSEFISSTALFLMLFFASLYLSSMFYDYSWDGRCYHGEAIVAMKNGWNPMYQHHVLGVNPEMAFWVDHYAKGLETISAVIYSATNELELGKAVNFILVFAAGFIFYHFLSSRFSFISAKKRFFLALIFSLCPVVVNQLFTFYIDWIVYVLLLILISLLIDAIRRPDKFNLYFIGVSIFILVTIKFNILFWVAFTLLCYFIYIAILKRYKLLKNLIISSAAGAILGLFLAGYNPYITNFIDRGNPFYPFMGEGKRDVITWIIPKCVQGKSHAEASLISVLSYPNTTDSNVFAFPWNLKKEYIEGSGLYDSRIGGFGAFFAWILILTTTLYCFKIDFKNKKKRLFDIFLLTLFLSLFLLPYGWWARYVPFFYAFPLVMLLYLEYEKKNRFIILSKNLIYLLIAVNVSCSLYYSCKSANDNKKIVDQTLLTLEKSDVPIHVNFGWNVNFKVKMDKRMIPYNETTEELGTRIFGPPVFFDSDVFWVEEGILFDKTKQE
ncbi:MAG: hypothetical protein LBH92_07125 [Bacteroidales bacterium]|jgi:hypothetical protein|nr:hypothetical protein [Bacteroidales bacterium]